jgi:tRNA A37 threonylcarbamoyladenosine dehydratase
MSHWLERSELLVGSEKLNKLANAHVMIVGLGGIGSFAGEFIARAGVGTLTLIDGDVFDPTNKNRQLTALDSTIGRNKAVVLGERIKDINPEIKLNIIEEFVLPERVWELLAEYKPDYVMDCIDSITPKVYLIKTCVEQGQRLISSMGAGGKMDASSVMVADIKDTYNDPFARLVRKRLHKYGIYTGFKSVFNTELVHRDSVKLTDGSNFKRSFYGTISYMPALFGLRMAAEVIEDLR